MLVFIIQCHRGRSLDTYFQGIFMETPVKLAVVGCGCSVATEPVAEISHQWNISQVSKDGMIIDKVQTREYGTVDVMPFLLQSIDYL